MAARLTPDEAEALTLLELERQRLLYAAKTP